MANEEPQPRDPPKSAVAKLLDPKEWLHEIVQQIRKRTVQAIIALVVLAGIFIWTKANEPDFWYCLTNKDELRCDSS